MGNRNYDLKSLQWDTDYFGVSSARVVLSGIIDDIGKEEILGYCRNYDFVTISNLNNIKENNYWLGCETNAFLVDINIQYQKELVVRPDFIDQKTYVKNNLSRNEQILDIAGKSFKFSRFFNDSKLPKDRAENIYQHWAACAFGREDKFFVISEREGNVAGFILFSMNGDFSDIELIAVDEKYQGQKVGKSLIHTMESFVIDEGVKYIKIGTQVNNIQVCNFYRSMGFDFVSCGSIYHLWNN